MSSDTDTPTNDQPRRWDDLVALGRALVAERDTRHWSLGDLAIEVARFAPLAEFADAIGLNYADFQLLRQVAVAWPPEDRRADMPWEWHRLVYRRADRSTVLADFLTDCQAHAKVPSLNVLRAYVGTQPRSGRTHARPTDIGSIRLVHDVPKVVDALIAEFDPRENAGLIRLLQARLRLVAVPKSG